MPSCAALASSAFRRCFIAVRSWRCQTQRTPAGEIDRPRRLSASETRTWPHAGCSIAISTTACSISAGVRFFRIGFLRLISCKASSLKYEEVYLNAYASVAEAKAGIGSWLGFYNEERQHQSLGYRAPRQAYEAECRWICGRSAPPTGCAFAHIPTGTTANHRIDVDEREGRSDVVTVVPSRDRSRY